MTPFLTHFYTPFLVWLRFTAYFLERTVDMLFSWQTLDFPMPYPLCNIYIAKWHVFHLTAGKKKSARPFLREMGKHFFVLEGGCSQNCKNRPKNPPKNPPENPPTFSTKEYPLFWPFFDLFLTIFWRFPLNYAFKKIKILGPM